MITRDEQWFKLENLPKEEWLPIKNFEKEYMVSSLGRVKSLERSRPHRINTTFYIQEKIMKGDRFTRYEMVRLSGINKNKRVKTHRLVAQAFVPNPENKPYINHKNGNRFDNRAINLEWCTQKENMVHARDNNLMRFNRLGDHHMAKKVINKHSGAVYGCAKEVSQIENIDYVKFTEMLRGLIKNTTDYEYI